MEIGTITFSLSYKPHFLTYKCIVLVDGGYLLEYGDFQHYSEMMEYINPIRGLVEILGHNVEVVINESLQEVHDAYVRFSNVETDLTERLFEEQPQSSKDLFDAINEL